MFSSHSQSQFYYWVGLLSIFALAGEFAFGGIHLITLWSNMGGIVWFQALTWAIAVLPLSVLTYVFLKVTRHGA